MRLRVFPVLVSLLVVACEPETTVVSSELVSSGLSLPEPTEQRRFQQALEDAGVPYTTEVRDGREYIVWSGDHDDRVQAIGADLFGRDLPSGRNIHFDGEMQSRFKSWLSENGISYATVEKRGDEYIVWEAAVDDRVRMWPYFPSSTNEN